MTQPNLIDPHPLIDEEVVTKEWPVPAGGPFKAVQRPTVREFLRLCAERVRAYWIGGKSV